MFKEGDIVEIPLPDGRTALGWILHISKVFKNAVGFIVFGIKGQLRNPDFAANPSLDVLGPLYTHIAALSHYGWKTIEHQPLTAEKKKLTMREVGGDIFVGDERVESVENRDKIPPMLVMGMPVVYNEIEKAFGKTESAVV
jgi:hypothetical protein